MLLKFSPVEDLENVSQVNVQSSEFGKCMHSCMLHWRIHACKHVCMQVCKDVLYIVVLD